MNHRLLLLTSALSIAGPSLIAAQPDLSKLPPPADRQGVTYEKDIRPIFEASCFGCHSRRFTRVRADLRLDTLQDVLKGSEDGKILTPGKSKDSLLVLAVSQLDDETAMPPKRAERPTGLMGRPGAFGPAMIVAGPMMTQADADHDKRLTKAEFTSLADSWFEKLDAEKAGKLNQEQFAEKFDDLLSDPGRDAAAAAPAQPDRFRGFQAGRFLAPAFFTAADADKDKSVTKSELKSTFEKWFTAWDTNKSGVLAEANLREGLNTSLPLQNPGANFGAGAELAGQMLTIGDKDKNQKLTGEELTLVADTWFDKFDTNKTGKVSQEQFVALSTEVFPRQQGMFGGFGGGGPRGGRGGFAGGPGPDGPREGGRPDSQGAPPGGGQRGGDGPPNFGGPRAGGQPSGGGPGPDFIGGPGAGGGQRGGGFPGNFGGGPGGRGGGRSFAPGLFAALDADKDGSLTKTEIENTVAKWLSEWDTNKTGSVNEDTVREKLNAMLPRPEFAGFGGPGGGGPRGPGNAGGRGGPPESGPAPKPLTPKQVGLLRAWIDQGAK